MIYNLFIFDSFKVNSEIIVWMSVENSVLKKIICMVRCRIFRVFLKLYLLVLVFLFLIWSCK